MNTLMATFVEKSSIKTNICRLCFSWIKFNSENALDDVMTTVIHNLADLN